MISWQKILAAMALSLALAAGAVARAEETPPSLVLMEPELEGDLSDPRQTELWPARLALLREALRKDLAGHGLYSVIDNTPQAALFDQLRKREGVHACEACVLDAATKLGADRVMNVWVYRVSALILTLHAVIRETATGQTVFRRSLDLRGDNDNAWLRAEAFLIRDLAGRPAGKR